MARRAFHAQQKSGMSTSDGRPTYAVAGFMSMLVKLISISQPQYLGVVFDAPGPTFRHHKLDTYKAQRKKPPKDFGIQLVMLKDLLEACAIDILEVSGVEADDVLASYAEQAQQAELAVEIATGDRDSFQLIKDPYVSVLYLSTRGGPDYSLYTEDVVKSKVGIPPDLYVDYAALVGDVSDNLPGVPGIGAKTAAKLVGSYGGIESILASMTELPVKNANALSGSQDLLQLNKEMMTLRRDVELPKPIGELKMKPPDLDVLVPKLVDLEFNLLSERIADALGVLPAKISEEIERISDVLECETKRLLSVEEAVEFIQTAVARKVAVGVSIALGKLDESKPHGTALGERKVKGVAVFADVEVEASARVEVGARAGAPAVATAGAGAGASADVGAADQPSSDQVYWIGPEVYADQRTQAALGGLFSSCPTRSHGAKEWMRRLLEDDIEVVSLQMDSELAGFLLESTGSSSDLRRLLKIHTGKTIPSQELASGQLSLSDNGNISSDTEQTALEALGISLLYEPLVEKLSQEGMDNLFTDMELPLLGLIVKMEKRGIGVDPVELKTLREELEAQVERLRHEIHQAAGRQFNVNSPRQLQAVLYEDLRLMPTKQTKRGPSTDVDSLQKLRGEHPIIELLLEYREVEKLRSTYAEGLEKAIDPISKRIRATFNQTGSITGRISSEAPNLHNIPVRTELGRQFRRVFVAEEGSTLVVADYDQIELRCIAHLAQDEGLIGAFTTGQDVHIAVASQVFGVEPADVTTEQRNRAKAVSYGLAYGMEAYGLAQRLGLSNAEAQEIIDDYFGAFSSLDGYMKKTIAQARERGYTETLFGRRRRIPRLSMDTPPSLRHMAERQAMNSGIQGLAADIFKVALIHTDQELVKRNLRAAIVLQVHDEIIFEVPDDEVAEVMELAKEVMSGAFEMSVPLVVSIASGKTWADAKS